MKILIGKTIRDQFYFMLMDQEGSTVMSSEMYSTKENCLEAVQEFKHCCEVGKL